MNTSRFSNRVCIIIVSYNHFTCLEACLKSLQASVSDFDKVIIIENHPQPNPTLLHLQTQYAEFDWTFNKQNNGFTGANHQGIGYALEKGYEYVFLLNPDTEIYEDTLECLVKTSTSLNHQWILGPLLITSDTPPKIDSAGLSFDRFYRAVDIAQGQELSEKPEDPGIETTKEVEAICGAAIFIPTKLFPIREDAPNTVFDKNYFAYFEDLELGYYWREKGGKMGICQDIWVIHQRGNASKLGNISRGIWRENRGVVERMILNRYKTIARYKFQTGFIKRFPLFILYELLRWLYIGFKKPYLLSLLPKATAYFFQKKAGKR